MKMLKDILKWQSEHTERMRKLMGVSHNTHLWMSFIKGLLIGILLMCIISCTPKNISPDVKQDKSPTTLHNLDAIGKVLGCMFAPSSEECEELRKKSKEQPNFED